MIVLLAFLPLQAWAGVGASSAAGIALTQSQQTSQQTGNATHALQATKPVVADQVDHGAPASQDPSYPADSAESSPPGADFAEQLLPAPLPRMVTAAGRSTVPQYVRTALPDPDLPLLPRPPRG